MATQAEILAIADAVVALLNGHAFDAPYATALGAARAYVPVYQLKDVGSLKVPVVPRANLGDVVSRQPLREMHPHIDVGFLKRLQPPAIVQQDVDDLLRLVEQAADLLTATTFTGLATPYTKAVPVRVSNDPVYDGNYLDQEQQFASVVTVEYKTFR